MRRETLARTTGTVGTIEAQNGLGVRTIGSRNPAWAQGTTGRDSIDSTDETGVRNSFAIQRRISRAGACPMFVTL